MPLARNTSPRADTAAANACSAGAANPTINPSGAGRAGSASGWRIMDNPVSVMPASPALRSTSGSAPSASASKDESELAESESKESKEDPKVTEELNEEVKNQGTPQDEVIIQQDDSGTIEGFGGTWRGLKRLERIPRTS